MFVIIVFLFGLVVGQDSNNHILQSNNDGGKEIPPAAPIHRTLQMSKIYGNATSLAIKVIYSSIEFPGIKWFNVHYWPFNDSSLICDEKYTFKVTDEDSKKVSKMHQVKVQEKIGNPRTISEFHLLDLFPNRRYIVCVESNQLKYENNTLAWCNCTVDFTTAHEIGGVRHLFINQETEDNQQMNVEWAAPAGFELNSAISYEVCLTDTNKNISCNDSIDLKHSFEIADNNVTSFNVCVSAVIPGDIRSLTQCVSASDSECAKMVTINVTEKNVTESLSNHHEVNITLGNSNCSYDVRVVCYKVPACKTISDCDPILKEQDGTYTFDAQKLASYKILVYLENKLVATKEYKHLADYSDKAVTEAKTDTSISVSWNRPWNIIEPVSFVFTIEGFQPQEFNGFTGCNFTMELKYLEPFRMYNGTLNVFSASDNEDGLSENTTNGRNLGGRDFSLTTNPGVCNEITILGMDQIKFNSTTEAYPTVLFRLPMNMTGKIINVHITLSRPNYGADSKKNYDPPECKSDGNCSLKIESFVQPDKEYTVELYCNNANTTLQGKKSRISYKTDPALPVIGRDILVMIKQTWNRRNNDSDIEVKISYDLLDNAAGTVEDAVICYGKKERLPRMSHGYLADSDGLNCATNTSIKKIDDNQKTKLKNLDFNEDYAAVLYYKNKIAYTYSNILYFRTRENPTHSIVAAAMIILIFIILFILTMYFSRLEKSVTPTINLPDLEFYPSSLEGEGYHHPISKVNWKEEFQELLREPKITIKKEFFTLSQKNIHGNQPPSTCIAEHENNLNKNRYFDIVPYDFSRVVLQALPVKDHEDYINASYIHGYKVNCGFIACQGPKENTVQDFWRMVIEKNVQVIVMLTRCVEGREKCYKYWPSVTPLITPSNTSIKLLQETADPSGDYTIRKFLVSKGWETQEVVQFHFTAWPDKKCPRTANFHSFISEVKSYGLSESSPVVVHCSAGVGRTGSFIALYNLLDEMHDETKDFIDIYYQVLKMRCLRSYMVQTQSQYIFLYESISQLFQDNSGEIPRNESADRMSDGDLEDISEDEFGIE